MDDADHGPARAARWRPRFWLQAGSSGLTAALAVLTLAVPDWIERATGLHPDAGGGEAEWLLAGTVAPLLLAASFGLGRGAARQRRAAIAR